MCQHWMSMVRWTCDIVPPSSRASMGPSTVWTVSIAGLRFSEVHFNRLGVELAVPLSEAADIAIPFRQDRLGTENLGVPERDVELPVLGVEIEEALRDLAIRLVVQVVVVGELHLARIDRSQRLHG